MTKLTKIKISQILCGGTFWISIIFSYLKFRTIPANQAYFLMSLYSISIVILEYPTGVIGDYFAHSMSYKSGIFIEMLAYFLLALPGNLITYAIAILLGALGRSLTSGSDDAILYSTSKSFEVDFKQIRTYKIILSIVSISSGSWLYKFNKGLPLILTGLSLLLSFLIILPVKINKKEANVKEKQGNIFYKATQGLLNIKNHGYLRGILLYSSLISAYYLSFKWLFNELFLNLGFKEKLLGLLISGLTVLTALGTKFAKKFPTSILINFIIFSILAVLTGVTSHVFISFTALTFSFLYRGVLETNLQIKINKAVESKFRASTISLRNLLKRLLSSFYLFILGIVSKNTSIGTFIMYSGLFIFVMGISILLLHNSKKDLI